MGVVNARKIAAMPRSLSESGVAATKPGLEPWNSSIIWVESTLIPIPAGKAISAVIRRIDSVFTFNALKFRSTHAAVTFGRALFPKRVVKAETRLK